MKLYRASEYEDAPTGSAFSPDLEVAVAYTDNPGFGGPRIYVHRVTPQNVLALHSVDDDIDALAHEIAPVRGDRRRSLADEWHRRGLHEVFQVLAWDSDVIEELRSLGYDWINYRDDFPEGAETWVWLGEDDLTGKRVPKKEWP